MCTFMGLKSNYELWKYRPSASHWGADQVEIILCFRCMLFLPHVRVDPTRVRVDLIFVGFTSHEKGEVHNRNTIDLLLIKSSHNTKMNPRFSPTPPKKKAKRKWEKRRIFFIKKNVKPIFLFDVELLIKIYVFNFF